MKSRAFSLNGEMNLGEHYFMKISPSHPHSLYKLKIKLCEFWSDFVYCLDEVIYGNNDERHLIYLR